MTNSSQTFLVTGGFGGFGQHLALDLSNSGHHVILMDNCSPHCGDYQQFSYQLERLEKLDRVQTKTVDIRTLINIEDELFWSTIDAVIHCASLPYNLSTKNYQHIGELKKNTIELVDLIDRKGITEQYYPSYTQGSIEELSRIYSLTDNETEFYSGCAFDDMIQCIPFDFMIGSHQSNWQWPTAAFLQILSSLSPVHPKFHTFTKFNTLAECTAQVLRTVTGKPSVQPDHLLFGELQDAFETISTALHNNLFINCDEDNIEYSFSTAKKIMRSTLESLLKASYTPKMNWWIKNRTGTKQ